MEITSRLSGAVVASSVRGVAVVAVALAVIAVATGAAVGGAAASVEASGPTGDALAKQSSDAGPPSTAADGPTNGSGPEVTARVTLITGHTVAVINGTNGTLYRVQGDANVTKHRTESGTYVFPEGVNTTRFDRALFDVDRLREEGVADGDSAVLPVILEWSDRQPRDGGGRRVVDLDSADRRPLALVNGSAAALPKAEIGEIYERLRDSDRVERVHYDAAVELSDTPDRAAIESGAARERYGVSGDGVTVAILDTGVDESHPDIAGAEVAERDFTGEGTTADRFGHGTAVAGLVVGDGTASNGTYVGVAPNASILDVRVLGSDGSGRVSDIVAGIGYAVDRDVEVVSMSLGVTPDGDRAGDPLRQAVVRATRSGALVVAASGNLRGTGTSGYGTVTSPGTLDEALTVGASDGDDRVAPFSLRGPTPDGQFVKPDLVAPGVDVQAPAADGGYAPRDGSSFAVPLASGAAALVRAAHPDWGPRRVRAGLTATADPIAGADIYTQGAGVLNVTAAVGADVVVAPGTVDFGRIPAGRPTGRTVTVTNTGAGPRTVNLSATVRPIGGGPTDAVVLNRSRLRLAAGDSATVRLTVSPDDRLYTPHSGRLTVGDRTVIFGYVPLRTVTVAKRGIDDVAGDTVTLVNTDTDTVYGPRQLSGGSVTVAVDEPGRYVAVSTGRDDGTPVITANATEVDARGRLVLDERRTATRTVDPASLPVAAGNLTTRLVAVNATVDGGPFDARVVVNGPPSPAVRVSETPALTVAVRRVLTVAPDDGAFDTPTVYHLKHVSERVEGDRALAVDVDRLDEQRVRYYRGAPGETYSATLAASEFDDVPLTAEYVTGELGDRFAQRIYVSPDLAQYHDAFTVGSFGFLSWSATPQRLIQRFEGDSTVETAVKKHPFRSTLRSWSLSADRFSATVFPTVGQPPRGYVISDRPSEEYTVWIDGERARSITRNAIEVPITLGGDGIDSVRLRVDDRHDVSPLSNDTVTTFGATTAGDDDRPPATPSVTFDGLDRTNVVPNGNLTVTVGARDAGSGVANVTLYVAERTATGSPASTPFADQSEWRSVALHARGNGTYAATLSEGSYRGALSVAVRVTDEAGNYVETTATDAVVVDSRRPTARLAADRTLLPANGTVRFDATGAYDDLAISEYRWDFDGDGTVDRVTTVPEASRTYESTGQVRPRLTVADAHGFTDTATVSVAVAERLPERSRELPASVRWDLRAAVTADRVATAGRSNGRRVVAAGALLFATGDSNAGVRAGDNSTVAVTDSRVNGAFSGHNVVARDARFNGGIEANGTVVVSGNGTVVNGDLTAAETVRVLSGATLRVTEDLTADRVVVGPNATLSVVQEANATRIDRNATGRGEATDGSNASTGGSGAGALSGGSSADPATRTSPTPDRPVSAAAQVARTGRP
ncbi:S8 family serine peptidase [Halosimplex litoreum]|uniref:S8 family serine peptidase n=1 Tax=Halosimplex litoreum TaxID=1198301 RepID=A0A7T3FYW6_9EURY|nr:S8 family serine peptidase [Halosimplex litoreum]QPV63288.1 S8 family serine peptidase [Halosimplex litoreum]